jgi:hypothetical protein
VINLFFSLWDSLPDRPYLNFSVAKANNASKTATIKNRVTILLSWSPFFS